MRLQSGFMAYGASYMHIYIYIYISLMVWIAIFLRLQDDAA